MNGKTPNNGNTKDAEVTMQLNWLNNFWRTCEITPINYVAKTILFWSRNCFISTATGETEFEITGAKYIQFNSNFIVFIVITK